MAYFFCLVLWKPDLYELLTFLLCIYLPSIAWLVGWLLLKGILKVIFTIYSL